MRILIKLLILILLGSLSACSGSRFLQEGYYFKDVDRYFNPKARLNLWVYYNFKPRENSEKGLRMKSTYFLDEQMLQQAGLQSKRNKLLFSVVPDRAPYYNMMAVQLGAIPKDLSRFEKVVYQGTSYFQRDIQVEQYFLRQVYIPRKNHPGISLITYFSDKDARTKPLTDFNYLVRINAYALQQNPKFQNYWRISGMPSDPEGGLRVNLPEKLRKKPRPLFLKVYEEVNGEFVASYLQLIDRKEPRSLQLDLSPGTYMLQYLDKDYKILLEEVHKHRTS